MTELRTHPFQLGRPVRLDVPEHQEHVRHQSASRLHDGYVGDLALIETSEEGAEEAGMTGGVRGCLVQHRRRGGGASFRDRTPIPLPGGLPNDRRETEVTGRVVAIAEAVDVHVRR